MLDTVRVIAKFVIGMAALLIFAVALLVHTDSVAVPRVLAAEISQIAVLIILVIVLGVLPLLRKSGRADLASANPTGAASSSAPREKYLGSIKFGASMLLLAALLAIACIPFREEFLRIFVQVTDLSITALFAFGVLYVAVGIYGILFKSGHSS